MTVIYLLRSAQYQFCNYGVVWNACMSMLTCIEPNFWDHGGYYGQESEEGKEGKEVSQEEKEVTRSSKHHAPDSV
jgi:hypothetical protein